MTKTDTRRRSPETPDHLGGGRRIAAGAVRIGSRATGLARATAALLVARAPGTLRATLTGAHDTTAALQTLPDPTLRWLSASSIGLGAGFYLAGAPRAIVAAAVAPAIVMGTAAILRPSEPAHPTTQPVRK